MTAALPPHVGREVDVETAHALVCGHTADGNPLTGALCGKPAAWHVRWNEAAPTVLGFGCEGHLGSAWNFHPHDVHPVEDSACGMPGTYWVPGPPSHCAFDVPTEEPALTGVVALPIGADVVTSQANHRKTGPGHPPITGGRRPLPCELVDPELFWPVSEADTNQLQIKYAKALCRQCPALTACRQWAIKHEPDGIWGATTPKERQTIKKRLSLAATRARVLREAGVA